MFSRLFGEKRSSIQGGAPSSKSREMTQTLNALEKLQLVRCPMSCDGVCDCRSRWRGLFSCRFNGSGFMPRVLCY